MIEETKARAVTGALSTGARVTDSGIVARVAEVAAAGGIMIISVDGAPSFSWANKYGGQSSSTGWSPREADAGIAAALAAGIAVKDCRPCPRDLAVRAAIRGPMLAITEWDSRGVFPPESSFGYAPRDFYADLWRAAGATVHNMPAMPADDPRRARITEILADRAAA